MLLFTLFCNVDKLFTIYLTRLHNNDVFSNFRIKKCKQSFMLNTEKYEITFLHLYLFYYNTGHIIKNII